MRGYVEVVGGVELQADHASTTAEIARDVRVVGNILQDIAELKESGTAEVEPSALYFLSDALANIAEALDRMGGDA